MCLTSYRVLPLGLERIADIRKHDVQVDFDYSDRLALCDLHVRSDVDVIHPPYLDPQLGWHFPIECYVRLNSGGSIHLERPL